MNSFCCEQWQLLFCAFFARSGGTKIKLTDSAGKRTYGVETTAVAREEESAALVDHGRDGAPRARCHVVAEAERVHVLLQ